MEDAHGGWGRSKQAKDLGGILSRSYTFVHLLTTVHS